MHDTYNDTEYDTLSSKILDTYTIHERYKTHQNWLCIQSSIHCSTPTKAAILYRVCIEVYRTRICSMDTTVDTRSIRLRYTFDTLRYKLWGKCTPIHGEKGTASRVGHVFPPEELPVRAPRFWYILLRASLKGLPAKRPEGRLSHAKA